MSQYIHPDCLGRLSALYNEAEHRDIDGGLYTIDQVTRIGFRQAEYLAKLVVTNNASRVLEIGFAYGFSTLAMLGALKLGTGGTLVSVDPLELSSWGGIGLKKVEEAGCTQFHQWYELPTHMAVPELVKDGRTFDFVFIDGDHHFDGVMLDIALTSKVLDVGGILAFDDMWMPAVRAAASFIRTNLAFEEIEAEHKNVAVFRKTAEESRSWFHFEPFDVPAESGTPAPV